MLEKEIDKAIRFSPAEARLYSLKAKVKYLQGDHVAAERYFREALHYAPTERSALLYMIDVSLRRADFRQAVKYLDLLLRRWPSMMDEVTPILPVLTENEAASVQLLRYMHNKPPWRGAVFQKLLAFQSGQKLLRSLLLKERQEGQHPAESELAALVRKQLKQGDARGAHDLFLALLPDQARQYAGSVIFDPQFQRKPSWMPFAWRKGQTSEAEIIIPWRGHKYDGGLFIRFNDMPAKLGNIYQTFVASPGNYQLKVRLTTRRLVLPKGLYWDVYCRQPKWHRLARISTPEGNHEDKTVSTSFKVPQGCSLLQLKLQTDLFAPSWHHRYRGEVIFKEVNVLPANNVSGN